MPAIYAELPSVKVTISNADGVLAYEGRTDTRGIFRTGNVPPGDYVVQFRSGKETMASDQYMLVLAAGKRKVTADALRGEQFAGGGVAMRLKVGNGMKIEGQIASARSMALAENEKVINGRIYRWMRDMTGSNIGPHWEEQGVGSARRVVVLDQRYLQYVVDNAGEGSLLNRRRR